MWRRAQALTRNTAWPVPANSTKRALGRLLAAGSLVLVGVVGSYWPPTTSTGAFVVALTGADLGSFQASHTALSLFTVKNRDLVVNVLNRTSSWHCTA